MAIDPKDTAIGATDAASKATEAAKKSAEQPKTKLTKSNDVMDQQQFLSLLVNQLQNQDPLNPMDSQEFAVQLAQFSQLEQLIGINGKLDGVSGNGFGGVGNMASYLGHEVGMSTDGSLSIADGKGPNVMIDIPAGSQSGRIDFIDANGNVASSANIDQPGSGRTVVKLDGIDVPDGDYKVRAVVVDSDGKFKDLPSKVTGTVEGFVLEPSPALIVNGEEVALEDVKEVFA